MGSSEIESILDSVKKKLGLIPEVVTEFDEDLIDAINLAFSILTQLGVGPVEGFAIYDNKAVWTDYTADLRLLGIARSYVYLRSRLLFDPPQSSYTFTQLEEKAKELEWRINVFKECPVSFPTA